MITFTIGDDKIVVPSDNKKIKRSNFITQYIKDFGGESSNTNNNNNNTKIEIPFDPQYDDVIDIYIYFIKDKRLELINVNIIVKAINFAVLLDDEYYLQYLVEQAYNLWSWFYPLLKNLVPEVCRYVYLYTPYTFVPDDYMRAPTFFEEWLVINGNRSITLDGNKVYWTKISYEDECREEMEVYHTVNNKSVGYKKIMRWYLNGNVSSESEYKDNKVHGTHTHYYSNGVMLSEENYDNGSAQGQWLQWYEDGMPAEKGYYDNNKRNGIWEIYHPDGILAEKGEYVEDKKHDLWQTWDCKGVLIKEEEYIHGQAAFPNINSDDEDDEDDEDDLLDTRLHTLAKFIDSQSRSTFVDDSMYLPSSV